MEYTQLPQTYRDDVLAEAIYAREVEWFHYNFDRANFEYILKGQLQEDYREDIRNRLSSTVDQMANVERIYSALVAQVTDAEAHAAAVARTAKKRENHVPVK